MFSFNSHDLLSYFTTNNTLKGDVSVHRFAGLEGLLRRCVGGFIASACASRLSFASPALARVLAQMVFQLVLLEEGEIKELCPFEESEIEKIEQTALGSTW